LDEAPSSSPVKDVDDVEPRVVVKVDDARPEESSSSFPDNEKRRRHDCSLDDAVDERRPEEESSSSLKGSSNERRLDAEDNDETELRPRPTVECRPAAGREESSTGASVSSSKEVSANKSLDSSDSLSLLFSSSFFPSFLLAATEAAEGVES